MAKSDIRRKTFVAREDLLDCMVKIAKDQGCSLFELVNDLFRLVIVADDLGFSLKRVVDERKILESAKGSGFVLGLERLWYEMADIAYAKDKTKALKIWSDSGIWFAAQYVTSGVCSSSFDHFKTDLLLFTWNAPEFDFKLLGDKLSVKITSPRFTEAYTFLFTSFLMSAIEHFGYQIDSKDVYKGIIRLNATTISKERNT
ncbi:MAG: hypothetical protein FWB84_02875 [Candidatus Bathyarchaeota archaeon]|uniref:hypothetical protein n=1 Tax=Candidatus Bathycorpusculum sp. TaxID=2994959 RepID=UPI0028321620|nr:hypothetical protein [Candidatus Termiticorpusculum sp.]MCL2257645.1 hypothetical protein [Candidatus Termiticorpusculum sp.]MCL2292219.1 hypothetical protein [Candidatus Termiticorpusculum sp.]